MDFFDIQDLLDSDELFSDKFFPFDEGSYESFDEGSYESYDESQNSVTPITSPYTTPPPFKRSCTCEVSEEVITIAPIALQIYQSKTEAIEEAMLAFKIAFRAKSATFPQENQCKHA